MRLFSICLIFSLVTLTACSKTEREEAVYQLIQEGVQLAQAHDLSGMMDLTRDDFTVGPGDHSRKEVRRILFVMLKRYGHFRILYPNPSVKLSEDEQIASVKMNFLIAKKDQTFPELELLYKDPTTWLATADKSADLYTLSMELRFDSGNWLLQKARITGFSRPHGRM
jgi:hypothetical protein